MKSPKPLSLREIVSRLGDCPVVPGVLRETDSTNAQLVRLAAQGAAEGTMLVASSQTAGRGTRGRSFASPEGSGIYFSVLLRPGVIDAAFVSAVTPAIAVAVARAIDSVFNLTTGIKWVNDLVLGGKKVAGILAEASGDAVICGVGINVSPPQNGAFVGLPNAGYIADRPPEFAREHVVAETARRLWNLYKSFPSGDFIHEYRQRSILLGEQVTVLRGGEQYTATATEIDDSFRLVVVKPDGTAEKLSHGEVSLKLWKNTTATPL